jgi:hypothetical protein
VQPAQYRNCERIPLIMTPLLSDGREYAEYADALG